MIDTVLGTLADQVREFIDTVRPKRIWLREDLWLQLSEEICGPMHWISSINGVPVLYGKHQREKG